MRRIKVKGDRLAKATRPTQDKEPEMEIMKTPEEKPEHLRDKKPEMEIRKKLNIQASKKNNYWG